MLDLIPYQELDRVIVRTFMYIEPGQPTNREINKTQHNES